MSLRTSKTDEKSSDKPKEPLALLCLDFLDDFWAYLETGEAKSVFITPSLDPPQRDPRPSNTGAFYVILTALIERPPAHLVQFSAPLEKLTAVDDYVDSQGTQTRLWAQLETFFEQARARGLQTHRGQWRAR